jgi:membrane protease YdiL (CAAX protease family)
MVLYILGGLGPIISAYLSILMMKEKNGLKEFHNHMFKWNLNIFWYIIPFIISFGVLLVSNQAYKIITSEYSSIQNIKPWFMIFPLFIQMFFGGGLEEPGWRGIALPELNKKYNLLFSSFILGIIWATWHIPLFFIKGVNQYGNNVLVFALGIIGLTLILSWIYNHTQSILICVIFHASFNAIAAMGFPAIIVPNKESLRGMITSLLLISLGIFLLLIFPKSNESYNRR